MAAGLLLGTAVAAYGYTKDGVIVNALTCDNNGFLSGLSDNGRWALQRSADYGAIDGNPRRYDLLTGKSEVLPLTDPAQQESWNRAYAIDITDDGEIIVGKFNEYPAYYKDGVWTYLPMDDRKLRGYMGGVSDVTPDGRWMTAWVSKSFTKFVPLLWKDGESVELGELPNYDEMYERGIIDKGTLEEHKAKGETPNVAFFHISADGKYILAGVDHNYPGWGCSYIIYETETKTYRWIADEERGLKYVSGASMCPSGEWVGCSRVRVQDNPDGTWEDVYHNALYHVPTGKMHYDRGGGGEVMDNEGNAYHGSIPTAGGSVSIPRLLRQKYGIDFKEATGYESTSFFMAISGDGKTITGQSAPRVQGWSVTLPEPFIEAAKDVNLLDTIMGTPATGNTISWLAEIGLTLTQRAMVDPEKQIIMKKDGELYREATELKSGGGSRYIAMFDATEAEEGSKYEIVIPEGTFYIAGTASRNNESVITYTGRGPRPATAENFVPSEGSGLMELSNYSIVMAEFDCEIVIPDTKKGAYLYELEDRSGEKVRGETALCPLAVVASGKWLGMYPTTSRYLPKEKEYEIVIPAGLVTDITGHFANEETTVRYKGAFEVKTPEQIGNILFSEDFSNPNVALGRFLQFEGDNNMPTPEMENWGFDRSNTPWNFSVRDDDEYDYCAASTSMTLDTGRESEDWLMLPALKMESAENVLSFKSQSYLNGKQDRLRVYVWKDENQYGSIDREMADRILKEGDLIYDERESPGAFEEVLAGDWKETELSLAKYAGETIHIAFLNRNLNQSAIFVDDIKVEYKGNYSVTTEVPATVVALDKVEVGVRVALTGQKGYDRVAATLLDGDGKAVSEYAASGLNLQPGETYRFTFKTPLPLHKGEENEGRVIIRLNDEEKRIDFRVKDLTAATRKEVLLEESTGSWCGWCPLGMLALENIEEEYGDLVNIVAVHNDDRVSYAAYDQFLSPGAYPAARINRGVVAQPTWSDPLTGLAGFTSPEGGVTFADYVREELVRPAEADLELTEGVTDGKTIRVRGIVKPALNRRGSYLNVLTVVTEDGLPGSQTNNLSGGMDPLFGDWSQAGSPAETMYNHVARGIGGSSFYGEPGLLPEDLTAGESYRIETRIQMPSSVKDPDGLHVVAVLIEGSTGSVINSRRIKVTEGDPEGVMEIAGETAAGLFTKVGGRILYDGDTAGVEVWSMTGQRLRNESLPGGIYIVTVTGRGELLGNRGICIKFAE